MNPFLNTLNIENGGAAAAKADGTKFDESSKPDSGREFEKLYNENISGGGDYHKAGKPEPQPLESGNVSSSLPKAINVLPGMMTIDADSNQLLNIDALAALQADNGESRLVGLPGREAALSLQPEAGAASEILPGLKPAGADKSVLRSLEARAGDILGQRTDHGDALLMRGIGEAAGDFDQALYAPSRMTGQPTGQIGPDSNGALLFMEEQVHASANHTISDDSGRLLANNLDIKEVRLSAEALSENAVNNVQSGHKGIAPENGRQTAEPEGAPADELMVPRTDSRHSMKAGEDMQNPEFGLQKNEATLSRSL
ncbi:MAG: hypothetical protein JSU69_03265, partial [Candidatus Zixiibacteriota bacterium]